MFTAAKNFAKNVEHSHYDSCIVVVLTHGEYDHLLGCDEKGVNINRFLQCFNTINAPLLTGKPKLFFIQACRGGNPYSLSIPPESPTTPEQLVTKRLSQSLSPTIQPSEADMIIAFATTPNDFAWRHEMNGSYFIQSVCAIFSKYSANEDICQLLTRVNRQVAKTYQLCADGYEQNPEFVNRLQKQFYFFPGIQNLQ
uniref:Uncharacterized protein n=1 Tax=Panagrolaimus davidi TaxID=227884 RepID=A0A914PRP0_9BILA